MGPFQWLFRDLPAPAFLFSSIAPSPGDSLWTSIPCLTLEDFQTRGDGRKAGENWFPALTLLIVLQTLSTWIAFRYGCVQCWKLRDTEKETFFFILEFTTFLSKGHMTCRSFNVRFVARVEKIKRECSSISSGKRCDSVWKSTSTWCESFLEIHRLLLEPWTWLSYVVSCYWIHCKFLEGKTYISKYLFLVTFLDRVSICNSFCLAYRSLGLKFASECWECSDLAPCLV